MPYVPIRLSRSGVTTPLFEAVLDTGAAQCIFDAGVAEALGISDIRSGDDALVAGVVPGLEMHVYAHAVRLHVEADTFTMTAYFTDNLPYCLLGRHGFLDKFNVTFGPFIYHGGFQIQRALLIIAE